ncbi:hypothetical protein KCM76_24765 [Zooshikella marina]|uniref:hypothetical protein n=1 Tax=Zooshikella ganghwensis TaxID=202772 RepID=UPI001BAE6F92|nr:hypothetical protein [Zooshikella ganghwensis]MBU2709231.1 hypothetical protein [Zooshikella ganghwensis]
MKKALLLIVLSVFFAGCGINVKRSVNDNVLVSNASPAIQLNIPKSFELVKSSKGKGFSQYHSGFSGSYDKKEQYYFVHKNSNGDIDKFFVVRFKEAGANTYYINDLKDKELLNRDNMMFKGMSYKTHFYPCRLPKDDHKKFAENCIIKKTHYRVLPPSQSRMFMMIYGEAIPCNEGNVSPQEVSEVNMRAIEFMNSL